MWRHFIIPLLLLPRLAQGDLNLDQSVYTNRSWGIKINIPEDWTASTQTGYPSLLLVLSPSKGQATISLAAGHLAKDQDLSSFVLNNKKGLQQMGYNGLLLSRDKSILEPAVWVISGNLSHTGLALHQFYTANARQVFVITLSCPPAGMKQHLYLLTQVLSEIIKQPGPEGKEEQSSVNLR